MLLDKNDKLLMIGDSITDAGRARPVGEDRGLGSGYPHYIAALLGAFCPDMRIRVLNTGVSGNTVRTMAARWREDVLDLGPDWVSVMIGVNDVWRQFDHPLDPGCHVYPDEYRSILENLVSDTMPQVKGMVLMTPFFIESRRDDAMRAMIDEYGQMVRETAQKFGTVFADTQAYFDELLRHTPSAAIAGDRVHPNHVGHMAAARAFLDAVKFPWK